jgi:hypothetical protein
MPHDVTLAGRPGCGAFWIAPVCLRHFCHFYWTLQRAKLLSETFDRHVLPDSLFLTSPGFSRIKDAAAVAATRGDLGQLAPRKKLLKSEKSSRKFLRPSKHFGKEGFSFSPSLLP